VFEIGASLREARERERLSYAEVEQATLIPRRYLEALEQEQFDRLPEGLYRRSFLREYAAFLGLDGETFVQEYELRTAPEPEPAARSAKRRPLSARRLVPALRPGRTALVAAVVVIAGIAVWRLGTGGDGGGTLRSVAPPVAAPAPPAPLRPPRRPAPRPPAPPPPRPAPAALVLTAARGDCWVSVEVVTTGRVVYARTLRQGQTLRFGLRKPLRVRLGAPWNLTAAIGRRPVTASLPATTGDVVVTSSGIR